MMLMDVEKKTTTFMLFSFLLLLSFCSVSMFLSVFSRLGRGLYECMHSHIHDQSWYILLGWVDEWMMMMNDLQHIRDRCCCFFFGWCMMMRSRFYFQSNPILSLSSFSNSVQAKTQHQQSTHSISRFSVVCFVPFLHFVSFLHLTLFRVFEIFHIEI